MVTKQEVDNILKEVNAILRKLDQRISALEADKKKPTTTRSNKSQQKDLTTE